MEREPQSITDYEQITSKFRFVSKISKAYTEIGVVNSHWFEYGISINDRMSFRDQ